jgi:hypothetical protein
LKNTPQEIAWPDLKSNEEFLLSKQHCVANVNHLPPSLFSLVPALGMQAGFD